MHQLYKLCTGCIPKQKEVKKILKTFNGFEFDRESDEFDKKTEFLHNLTVSALKQLCELLDLERIGTKEVLVERLLDFLMEPVDSGRPVPEQKPRGRSKGRPKNQTKKSDNDESMDLDESDQSEDDNESSKDEMNESKEKDDKHEPAEQNGHEKDSISKQAPTVFFKIQKKNLFYFSFLLGRRIKKYNQTNNR